MGQIKKYQHIPAFFAINLDGIRYMFTIKEDPSDQYELDLKKITDISKLIREDVNISEIPYIQKGFNRILEENKEEKVYQNCEELLGDIIENLPELLDDSPESLKIDELLSTINAKMERLSKFEGTTRTKRLIKTQSIGERSENVPITDKLKVDDFVKRLERKRENKGGDNSRNDR